MTIIYILAGIGIVFLLSLLVLICELKFEKPAPTPYVYKKFKRHRIVYETSI